MADLPQDWYVTLPLKDLDSLVAAARELPQMQHQLERCYEQLDACRVIQTEVLEKYRELYKML